MTDLSESMARLIQPWTITIPVNDEHRPQEFPALVDMLAGRVFPDANFNGGSGMPSQRNVLDVKSLDLLTHITDVTRAWLNEWGIPTSKTLSADLRAFWDHLHVLHQSEGVDALTYENLAAYPDVWAVRIWDLIEPPMKHTFRGVECPRCGRARWTTPAGDVTDSILLVWRDGQEPSVECQWEDCVAIWVGEPGLLELGREIGEEVNVEALQEARAARLAGMVTS